MPVDLLANQHELLSEDTAISLVFGTVPDTPYLTLEHPSIEGGDERFGDSERTREDGVVFGEDFKGGKSAVFSIGVLTDAAQYPHEAGADALDRFQGVWENKRLRSRGTAIAVLRSHMVPGRVRRCYGRPRRYAEITDRLSHKGANGILCDFVVGDGTWYDDEASSVSVLIPSSGSGMSTPLGGLLVNSHPSSVLRVAAVGGTKPTWPVITFTGPVTNPRVQVGDVVVALDGGISYGEQVTYDPRPWKRTFTSSNGTSYAGALAFTSTPMPEAALDPNTGNVITYTGIDPTGTSSVKVEWRNAWSRW